MLMSSSVARRGSTPPLVCEVCKIARFCCFSGRFLVKNRKQPPPKEIGCRSREIDVVIRCEKALEFLILAEKSDSISWRPPVFGLKKRFNFRAFREIRSQFSDKPCESNSRTMKIRVKVVCTFLTLSKKPPPLFQILATRLLMRNGVYRHLVLPPLLTQSQKITCN